MSDKPKHQLFATRLGVIAATVGSAVGLGNIWRFPYEAGVHGGGAFLVIYVFFIVLLGIPVLCAEFALGRSTHCNVLGCFRHLKPGQPFWKIIGVIGVTSGMMILSFYSVIAGWTLEYFVVSLKGEVAGNSTEELHSLFGDFTAGLRPVMWTVVFLLINYCVIVRGVRKGVEKA
ncbi:MAG: sodium-dependent transporter, partial [Muribaculaceae bacterium]|nr:sodium-dependent transporter [Muribaculaceae bacterium]